MKHLVTLFALAGLLAGCGPSGLSSAVGSVSATGPARALDAASLGGLADSLAAHPSVELATPGAFALGNPTGSFLSTLSRVVGPQREALATALSADPTVTEGLAAWGSSSGADQLAVLKQVAALEARVMNFQLPLLSAVAGDPNQAGLMAYFQAGASGGAGEVVLYPDVIAKGGKFLALATLVHEMRHAAQYQLVQANRNPFSGLSGDQQLLASGYAEAWSALDALGGEQSLAYGDYAHLNVEYDAFQTGNEVAARVSNGQYDASGIGFVDTHFATGGSPSWNLLALGQTLAGSPLVEAVNRAEYLAERSSGGSGGAPQRSPRRRRGRTPRPF